MEVGDRSQNPESATLLPASDLLWQSNYASFSPWASWTCSSHGIKDCWQGRLLVCGGQSISNLLGVSLQTSKLRPRGLICVAFWATLKLRTRPYVLTRKGHMYLGNALSLPKGSGLALWRKERENGYHSYTGPPKTLSCLGTKEHMNSLCRDQFSWLDQSTKPTVTEAEGRTHRKDIYNSVWQTTLWKEGSCTPFVREFSFLRPQGTKHEKNKGYGNNRSWKSFENLDFMWRHPRSHTLVEASSSSCTFATLLSKWQWDRQVPASGPSMVCGQHTPPFPLNLHIWDFPATRCFTSRVSVRSAFILIVLDSQQHGVPLSDEHCKNGILSTRLGGVGLLLSLHFCSCISEAQAYCAFQEAARSQRQE